MDALNGKISLINRLKKLKNLEKRIHWVLPQWILFSFLRVAKVLQRPISQKPENPETLAAQGFPGTSKPDEIIPTQWCRWAWESGPGRHG